MRSKKWKRRREKKIMRKIRICFMRFLQSNKYPTEVWLDDNEAIQITYIGKKIGEVHGTTKGQ